MHLLERVLLNVVLDGSAEIDYLQRFVRFVVDNVLRFQVPVDHALLVAVGDGLQDLLYNFGRLVLGKLHLALDGVEQLDALAQLRHQVVVDFIFEHFVDLHDVRMIKLAEYAQLRLKKFLLHAIHLFLFDNLYRPPLLRPNLTLARPHLPQRTLPQYSSQLVAIFELLLIKSN